MRPIISSSSGLAISIDLIFARKEKKDLDCWKNKTKQNKTKANGTFRSLGITLEWTVEMAVGTAARLLS